MVVSSVYFARSGAGMDVAVGNTGVAVGKRMGVAVDVNDAVGVAAGAGSKDAQEEKIDVNRKMARMDGVNLFRMGCILPLVEKNNKKPSHRVHSQREGFTKLIQLFFNRFF
jgi:hypothetical protein